MTPQRKSKEKKRKEKEKSQSLETSFWGVVDLMKLDSY